MDITNVGGSKALNQADSPDAERRQIKLLAQQFEAMLVTQMLREMRKSMIDEDNDGSDGSDGFGADALMDTGDIELGQALSRTGGVGLTDALLAAFENQIAPAAARAPTEQAGSVNGFALASGASAAVRTGITPAAGGTAGFALDDITAAAPISSRFGWREDPLTGVPRFHQGVDIAVAYGHDVKAAAEGTVAFAGVQNGYGQTVVIDHADGRQTRYAHLSEPLVHAGDVVSEGQIVGKSGNSGRSTGPHLHFEVLVDGHPVDPTSAGE
jgi:murein DD-endopeptidase MepM/ murein hydrolase activator NlpD